MTKKKVESTKGARLGTSEPQVQNIEKQVTRSAPEWNLVSMVKDDDIVPTILKSQHDGWKVFQILPSGSYYSILFTRG